jgi:hypothetical protein
MLDRYAIFSTHAKERLHEFQLTLPKACWLLYQSEVDYLPKEIRDHKREKYTDKAIYRRYGTIIFTLLPIVDKHTNDEVYLVVSVYDQLMDLE